MSEQSTSELDRIQSSLTSLHEKVDKALALLNEMQARPSKPSRPKPKPQALTEDDIASLQTQFDELYQKWSHGDELDVQNALDEWDAEQLRRFADANNLNVTAKMPKQRVLQLIGARFREKKQLLRSQGPRDSHES